MYVAIRFHWYNYLKRFSNQQKRNILNHILLYVKHSNQYYLNVLTGSNLTKSLIEKANGENEPSFPIIWLLTYQGVSSIMCYLLNYNYVKVNKIIWVDESGKAGGLL